MIPLEELAEKWFKIFSLMTVQNTVFLAIGLPLLLLLKRVSPRLRTIIMIAILIKMLIPPLPLPSLFQHHITSPLQMLDGVFSTATLTDSSSNSHHFSIPTFLFIIWSGVGSMIIILNIYHLLRYYHIARSGIPLKRDSEIKTSDSYSVVSAEKCSTPYIIGFFRPQIVLPAMMRDWKDSDLNIILAHEKAHWKFKDPWINVLQVVVQSFYFFHPLVWLLIREMNYLRELASDEVAMKQLNLTRPQYAHVLVSLAEFICHVNPLPMSQNPIINFKSTLKKRIMYHINLKEDAMRYAINYKHGIIFVLLVALSVLFSCDLTVTQDEKAPIVSFKELTKKPEIVKRIDPEYPEKAQESGIEGVVILKALIDESGKVEKIEILKAAHPLLSEVAIKALEKYEFTPAEKDGEKVKTWFSVPFAFRLKSDTKK